MIGRLLHSCSHREWFKRTALSGAWRRAWNNGLSGRMLQVEMAGLCQGAEQNRSNHGSSGCRIFYDFSVCFGKHPVDDQRAEE